MSPPVSGEKMRKESTEHVFPWREKTMVVYFVVEPTHLKNMSQIASFPQIGVNIKNIQNHHLVVVCLCPTAPFFPGSAFWSSNLMDKTPKN